MIRELHSFELNQVSGGGIFDLNYWANSFAPMLSGVGQAVGNALIGTSNFINVAQQNLLGPVGSLLDGLGGPLLRLAHQFNDYVVYQATSAMTGLGQSMGGNLTPASYHYVNEWVTYAKA